MQSFSKDNHVYVYREHISSPPFQPMSIEGSKGDCVEILMMDLMHSFIEKGQVKTTMTPVEDKIPDQHHCQKVKYMSCSC